MAKKYASKKYKPKEQVAAPDAPAREIPVKPPSNPEWDLRWLLKFHGYIVKDEAPDRYIKVFKQGESIRAFDFLVDSKIKITNFNKVTNEKTIQDLHISDAFNYI